MIMMGKREEMGGRVSIEGVLKNWQNSSSLWRKLKVSVLLFVCLLIYSFPS